MFKVAVGFVVVALILLAGSLYMSVAYMKQEQQLAAAGDIEGAVEKTRAAARFNPFDSMPLMVQSNLLQQQGQDEAAERALREAIDRDPANYANFVYLGNLQSSRLNQPEAAVDSYAAALEKIPRDTGLIFALAQAHTQVGDLEAAKQEYEKLVELEKIPPRGLFNLGKIYVRTGDPEKGVETLLKAKKRASANLEKAEGAKREEREAFVTSVNLALADALVVEGRYDEARAALAESGAEQAPAILELLNTDPEGYRETVLNSEV
ncbi:tetratricopeptide repeat protein [Rubrobacter marinus]|uniref:tetratricopeptide repeat protein n=1 Tax=Rubrobacter marinus TaxID=2653852 RepID=UPI00140E4B65|nr:tetratricopeptide repeat protein [Rubrobacter marinus]